NSTYGTPSYDNVYGNGTVPLNTLTHVAVVRNGPSLSFYINGVLDASIAAAMDTNPFRNGINTLRIGGQGRGGVNRFFAGRIDEVRLYNAALTAAQIQTDMATPITAPTVAITSPTSNPTYTTSSSSLTLGGTAFDNVGVTQVTWANSLGGSGTASGTTSWASSGIVLQTGTNVLTVQARDAAGNTATTSLTVTLSVTLAFTDDPLAAQSTLIKTVHITELRAAVDSVRVARGLATFAWTDATLTPGTTAAKLAHVHDLRTALDQAYQAAGRSLPTYTDPILVSMSPIIKAIHLNELRTAVSTL